MTDHKDKAREIVKKLGADQLEPEVLDKLMEQADVIMKVLQEKQGDVFLTYAFTEICCHIGDIVHYLELDKHPKLERNTDIFRNISFSVSAWMAAHPEQWWEYIEQRAQGHLQGVIKSLVEEMGGPTDGPTN